MAGSIPGAIRPKVSPRSAYYESPEPESKTENQSACYRRVFFDGHWNVHTDGWIYTCDAVILANGSKASSVAGSGESGYKIARSLGHHLIEPLPALTAP